MNIEKIELSGYEHVIEAVCKETSLHCFIAIHNTSLGQALGGLRIFPYKTRQQALDDVLSLSKGMTLKAALARCGVGGGKAVIIADPKKKNENLLHSFGKVLNELKGNYITAEDLGSTPEDMAIIKEVSPYVSCLKNETSTGDPSRFTARGVFLGIQAVLNKLFHSKSVKGRKIAIQGLGATGEKLAEILFWEGAHLIVSDIDTEKAKKFSHFYGASLAHPDEILTTPCDILSPCAIGSVITHSIVSQLKCKGIAGAANNQLEHDSVSVELQKASILYAPDFVINAGGLINAVAEFEEGGYHPLVARDQLEHIPQTLEEIFNRTKKAHHSTDQIAKEMASELLKAQIGKRKTPIFT